MQFVKGVFGTIFYFCRRDLLRSILMKYIVPKQIFSSKNIKKTKEIKKT